MGRKRGGVSPEASVHPQIPEDSHVRKQAGCAQSAAEGEEMENCVLVAALAVTSPGDHGSGKTLFTDSKEGNFYSQSWSGKSWNRGLGKDPAFTPRQQFPFPFPFPIPQ